MLQIKLIFKTVFFSVFTILFLNSCQNNSKNNWKANVINSVEGDVAVVGSIDIMNILNKSDIMNSEFLPEEYKGMMNMYVLNTLKSENLGFKIEGNNHVVVVVNETGEFDYVFFMADVLDEKKMSKNLKFLIGGSKEVKDYNYLTTSEGVVIAWDEKNVIGLLQTPKNKKSTNSISILSKLLDSRDDNSIKSSEDLTDFLERKDDINAFVYSDVYSKMTLSLSGMGNDKFNSLDFKDRNVVFSGNINNGNILFESSFDSPNQDNELRPLMEKPINSDYLNYLSNNGQLLAFFLANINIEGIVKSPELILQFGQVFKELEILLKQFDLNLEDISNTITGEMSFSILDLNTNFDASADISDAFGSNDDDFFNDLSEDEFYEFYDNYDNQNSETTPKMLLSLGIKNKNSIVNLFKKFNYEVSENVIVNLDNQISFLLKDKTLFIGSPESLLVLLNENGKLIKYNPINEIDTPIYGFINTDTMLIPNNFRNQIDDEFGAAYMNLLSEIKYVEFKSTVSSGRLEIVMDNKQDNALKVLVNSILKSFSNNVPIESFI
ncbi:MAG: hypothetical protein P8M12_01935 [Flavobacteriales bacterium]|nr:hypothetical protein [Flavobacteriales bacterium]